MSEHMKDPIKKVQLDFNPILHHLVGKYTMKSTVTHQTKDGAWGGVNNLLGLMIIRVASLTRQNEI